MFYMLQMLQSEVLSHLSPSFIWSLCLLLHLPCFTSLRPPSSCSVHPDLATSSVPDLIPKMSVGHYGKPSGEDVGPFPGNVPMDTVADSKSSCRGTSSRTVRHVSYSNRGLHGGVM